MTRLKWTVLATHVPPEGSLGGVVRYTTELLAGLARRDDVEVSAVANAQAVDAIAELTGDRARVATLPDAATPLLSVVERYAPLPIAGADVVHGVKHLVPRRTDALRVLTVHDMLLLDRPEDFGRVKRHLLPPPYRGSIRDADLVVCVSRATRDRLGAAVPAALPRATVIPLATSAALRDAAPRPIPQLVDRRFVLVVGDSSPRKNLATLVAAWPAVRAAAPDAVLAIAGPPSWGRSVMGELYQQLVDEGAVVPLGRIADDQLRWCYDHAGVVACPSLAEGFGLPAAEALALGAPVVVSDDPALVEVAAGRARAVVPATDRSAWETTLIDALHEATLTKATLHESELHRELPTTPLRGWDDVIEETVAAVHDVRASGGSRRRAG